MSVFVAMVGLVVFGFGVEAGNTPLGAVLVAVGVLFVFYGSVKGL